MKGILCIMKGRERVGEVKVRALRKEGGKEGRIREGERGAQTQETGK